MERLSITEAARLIRERLKSTLPLKYWIRFIGNHSRQKSNDNPFVWCQMKIEREGNKSYVISDDIEKFLAEAVNHEFPLKSINDGYKRHDKPQRVKQRVPILVPVAEPVKVNESDRYAREAIKSIIDSNPTTKDDKSRAFDILKSIINLWGSKS